MKPRIRLLTIPLAALIAVLPLIHYGPSCGHDFDFHLLSWMEAARQFSHGNLHPHWAFTPAYNAGEPRFVFYPPISWTLGALLGLVLTHLPGVNEAAAWSAAPILYTWLALTLSGISLYRLARLYASQSAALIAATLYLANPYMLFTAYERTAYAELLAAAVIPLLLQSILCERVTIARIALPVALLWLINAPAAVMGSYALAFIAIIRIINYLYRNSALPFAQKTLAGTTLGLAMAAFYILPATLQRRFVQITMATSVAGLNVRNNFLFAHTGTDPDALLHDAVLRTASWIAVILITATTLALATAYLLRKVDSEESSDQYSFPSLSLTLLTAGIAFLLTPLSLPLWRHAPQVLYLQFPWRLLAILAPVFAIATARAMELVVQSIARVRERNPASQCLHDQMVASLVPVASLILVATLILPAYHHFRQPCNPEDTVSARLVLFHSGLGSDPTDEYTPVAADNDALAPPPPIAVVPPTLPPYWLADSPVAAAPTSAHPGPAPTHLTLTLARSGFLILNLRNYPAWHITLNGSLAPHSPQRDDGLVALALPVGLSTIEIHYSHLPSEIAGDAITLLALVLFAITLRKFDDVR